MSRAAKAALVAAAFIGTLQIAAVVILARMARGDEPASRLLARAAVSAEVAATIDVHLRALGAVGRQFTGWATLAPEPVERVLAATLAAYPDLGWLALVDREGRVVARAENTAAGTRDRGSSDPSAARRAAKKIHVGVDPEGAWLELAAPVGENGDYLAADLATNVLGAALAEQETRTGARIFVVADGGRVLHPRGGTIPPEGVGESTVGLSVRVFFPPQQRRHSALLTAAAAGATGVLFILLWVVAARPR